MSSPFKMNPKSPFMKALVGKQGNLPQHLQDAIKAAPAKSYGKSPVKKTDPKKKETEAQRRDRLSVGEAGSSRGAGGQRTFAEGKVKANVGKERGATDLAVEIPKAYRKAKKYVKSKLGLKMEPGTKKRGTGVRRDKKPLTPEQQKSVAAQKEQMKKNAAKGRGTGVIYIEHGVKRPKDKRSPVRKTDPNLGSKKRKLGTEGMTYKEKMAYYEKQKKAKTAKNPKIKMGMGSSYTTLKK